ncbi:MAG: ABC transporter ATP-binding protein [Saprospiraceae bacterium]|nr:ABC transporter ATP-binding protein [Saprospiraceae bacterium]
MTPLVHLAKVNKTYQALAGPVPALRQLDLSIQAGENVVITGKSGSGKSTLLNLLAGLDRPDSGEVKIAGAALQELSEAELALWRGQHVGIVFQFYHLFPTLTALDNILFAMELVNCLPKQGHKERAMTLLEQVGLGTKANKFPNELSGGEQQRIAIARAMANDPLILLADEPTGNLDTNTGQQIKELFAAFHQGGKTLITVTHEAIKASAYDQVITLADGQLIST